MVQSAVLGPFYLDLTDEVRDETDAKYVSATADAAPAAVTSAWVERRVCGQHGGGAPAARECLRGWMAAGVSCGPCWQLRLACGACGQPQLAFGLSCSGDPHVSTREGWAPRASARRVRWGKCAGAGALGRGVCAHAASSERRGW
eukprot:2858745-Prymnesium_polylepis.1